MATKRENAWAKLSLSLSFTLQKCEIKLMKPVLLSKSKTIILLISSQLFIRFDRIRNL